MNNGKFCIKDGKLFNKDREEFIPDDEPVFILRARDVRALGTIRCYQSLDSPFSSNWQGVQKVMDDFQDFKTQHGELMGQPTEVY